MGLDMLSYSVEHNRNNTLFEIHAPKTEIFHWNMHFDLHEYLERIFDSHGGDQEFNGIPLRLSLDDLALLENIIVDNSKWKEEFSDEYTTKHAEQDLKFIDKAKLAIANGCDVYYLSWY